MQVFFFHSYRFIQSGGLSWDFLTTLKINSCQEQCATEQHHLHPIDILSYHNHFTQLPRPARCQWVLDYLNTHSSHDTSSGEPVTIYLIGGKPVCQPLWIATLDIPTSSVSSGAQMATARCFTNTGITRSGNQMDNQACSCWKVIKYK